jgi:hypothetical protein
MYQLYAAISLVRGESFHSLTEYRGGLQDRDNNADDATQQKRISTIPSRLGGI